MTRFRQHEQTKKKHDISPSWRGVSTIRPSNGETLNMAKKIESGLKLLMKDVTDLVTSVSGVVEFKSRGTNTSIDMIKENSYLSLTSSKVKSQNSVPSPQAEVDNYEISRGENENQSNAGKESNNANKSNLESSILRGGGDIRLICNDRWTNNNKNMLGVLLKNTPPSETTFITPLKRSTMKFSPYGSLRRDLNKSDDIIDEEPEDGGKDMSQIEASINEEFDDNNDINQSNHGTDIFGSLTTPSSSIFNTCLGSSNSQNGSKSKFKRSTKKSPIQESILFKTITQSKINTIYDNVEEKEDNQSNSDEDSDGSIHCTSVLQLDSDGTKVYEWNNNSLQEETLRRDQNQSITEFLQSRSNANSSLQNGKELSFPENGFNEDIDIICSNIALYGNQETGTKEEYPLTISNELSNPVLEESSTISDIPMENSMLSSKIDSNSKDNNLKENPILVNLCDSDGNISPSPDSPSRMLYELTPAPSIILNDGTPIPPETPVANSSSQLVYKLTLATPTYPELTPISLHSGSSQDCNGSVTSFRREGGRLITRKSKSITQTFPDKEWHALEGDEQFLDTMKLQDAFLSSLVSFSGLDTTVNQTEQISGLEETSKKSPAASNKSVEKARSPRETISFLAPSITQPKIKQPWVTKTFYNGAVELSKVNETFIADETIQVSAASYLGAVRKRSTMSTIKKFNT